MRKRLLLLPILFACQTNEPGNQPPPDKMPPDVTGPTYHQDVRPLLAEKCGGCHLQDGIAPFDFEDYESTKGLATLIAGAVESQRMPPWGAFDTPDCNHVRPWKNDLRLNEAEIKLLEDWASTGAAEGEKPATVEPFSGNLSTLPRVDQTLTPDASFTTQGLQDQFICFVIDPGFLRTTYLEGIHFLPGNDKVVHHAILYSDPSGEADGIKDADGKYTCFGGPGVSDSAIIGAWAPGGIPFRFPETSAMELTPGTNLILQIHYHPIGMDPEEDLTSVQLMTTTEPPEYLAAASFIGNFPGGFNDDEGLLPGPNDPADDVEFMIPANTDQHTEQMRLRIPFVVGGEFFEGAYIHSVASHMHYVGVDMNIQIHRGSENAACSNAEMAPLQSCMDAACPGATGVDSVQCATDFCPDQTDALSQFCGSCLEAHALNGAADAFAPCSAPLPMPTETYGNIPDQPAEECLLQTPKYSFEWQRFYEYDAPIAELPFVRAGDTFEFKCTYDNTMNNPFVRDAVREQNLSGPADVVLGDETLDEMCLIALTFLVKR